MTIPSWPGLPRAEAVRAFIFAVAMIGLLALAFPAGAINVDGRISPEEWSGAQHITDFRLTQPLSRAASPYPTDAWVLATPEGLAIGFRNVQSDNVPRTRQSAQRDIGAQADRVNIYVDFDGDGRAGYNFTILLSDSIIDGTITNENQFNNDWDGYWRHAVAEDDGAWSVEVLLPWYIAPMQDDASGKRRLGLSLDRVVGATGERVSWPAISFLDQRFLTLLSKVEVPAYNQSLLSVTPYAVGIFDNISGKSRFDSGADIFWKPNGRFQLSATLNPDFGQVESDQLVVNFSATETYFSDKRPFFTENQGYFDVPFGSLGGNNRVIYTRRVGGLADDGSGAGDVTAAAKVNGSLGTLNYGAFVATEADATGRDFYVLRTSRDFVTQGVGAMVTRVDHPFLDRQATVYEFDHRWTPNARWGINTTIVDSHIKQDGQQLNDTGAQLRVDHDMGDGWRQQLYALHIGDQVQMNDFGFLDRNDYNYARYDVGRRIVKVAPTSAYASHDWHIAVSSRSSDQGLRLTNALLLSRFSDMKNGGYDYWEVTGRSAGRDDLITRGHGVVRVPATLHAYYERFWPRKERLGWYAYAYYAADGLDGPARGSLSVDLKNTYFFSDTLSVYQELFAKSDPDWLLWRGGNQLGTYRAKTLQFNAGLDWTISSRQELRIKLESIALDARARQYWLVADDGTPVMQANDLSDFNLRNLGFQVRYRYELAPLSNLYVAYVRGGFASASSSGDVSELLGDAFSLRDTEQLLVKLSYRFEL